MSPSESRVFFYGSAYMQGGLSHERYVCICASVCLSNARIRDKTTETSAHILIPHERTFILVFRHEERLAGDDSLYLKFWTKLI